MDLGAPISDVELTVVKNEPAVEIDENATTSTNETSSTTNTSTTSNDTSSSES